MALAAFALLALAGCGGSQIEADQVQAPAPVLTIPKDDSAPAADETPDADETPTPTPTPTADASGGTTTTPPAAATQAPAAGAGTGGAGTDQGTTQPQQDPADTGGAQAEENFDTFCEENPGACP